VPRNAAWFSIRSTGLGGSRDRLRARVETSRRAGLIDEYVIVTHPVLPGGGTPFFTALDNRVKLNLVETRTFPDRVLLTSSIPRTRYVREAGEMRARDARRLELPGEVIRRDRGPGRHRKGVLYVSRDFADFDAVDRRGVAAGDLGRERLNRSSVLGVEH